MSQRGVRGQHAALTEAQVSNFRVGSTSFTVVK